jgi:hypothetical protein
MSYTTIMVAGRGGRLEPGQDFSNAWWGAGAVWSGFGSRFLGFPTDWCWVLPQEKPRLRQVWNLTEDTAVAFEDRVTLATTFDGVVVRAPHFSRVADSLAFTARWLPSSNHLAEQAEYIRTLVGDPRSRAIAWIQTSVASDGWSMPTRHGEDCRPYNVYRDRGRHWWLFENGGSPLRPGQP